MNNKTDVKQLSPLKRAYLALETMQEKLEALERRQSSPIAVIGMSCRFPGAADIDSYWKLLRDGVHAVGEIPPGRWDVDTFYDPDPEAEGKMYTRHGGFLNDVSGFDASFFGISPREATHLDPQQRILLETAWEAMQDAGAVGERLAGQTTGVFIGITSTDFSQRSFQAQNYSEVDSYHITGNTMNAAAGRLSYCFGFRGPCIAVDTACSSSLSAMHQAVRSLQCGECETALAGGVNLMLSPLTYIALSKTNVLSPSGVCRAFDAGADGMVRGEGCGVVVLKTLDAAQRDGDRILAVIRGSAVNQDGPSSGLTVPNGPAQELLIQTALKHAGLKPDDVSYIEAHGTGTSLGDPIELRALAAAYTARRSNGNPLWIGSVKTNIGHLEAGAGIAGFIKLVLMLQHRELPPHLHFNHPTTHFDWNRHSIRVVQNLEPWAGPVPLRCGLSSFGFSGVNAHVLLEEAPQPVCKESPVERPLDVLALSAHNDTALRESAKQYVQFLNEADPAAWKNICFSVNHGRGNLDHRLAITASSNREASQTIESWLNGDESPACIHRQTDRVPKIAFLFTGQGAQYPRMARQLYDTHEGFHGWIDECDRILNERAGISLLDVLYGSDDKTGLIHRTDYTQPALFAVEYALAKLWRSWGVEASVVMGHSVGEYAAACIAGVFSLEDGLALIAERARLIHAAPGDGAMLAVACDLEQAKRTIESYADVSIAAVNAPEQTVLSGNTKSIQALQSFFEKSGVMAKPLKTSHAFHSPLLDGVVEPFRRFAEQASFSSPQIPLISNLTTKVVSSESLTSDYWAQHVREPVLFHNGVKVLQSLGVDAVLEIGPKPILLALARSGWDGPEIEWLPSLKSPNTDWQEMLSSLANLYAVGTKIDWREFDRPYGRQRVSTPLYPFQRERFWPEESGFEAPSTKSRTLSSTTLLGARIPMPGSNEIRFESAISLSHYPFLCDHQIHGAIVLPAAAYVELLLEAAQQLHTFHAIEIDDLSFHAPCILSDGSDLEIQTVLEPLDTDCYRFQIFSRCDSDDSWQEHVVGKLTLCETIPDEIKSKMEMKVSGVECAIDEHYAACRNRGVDFGPAFQAIRELRCDERDAFSSIQLPTEAQTKQALSLHPVLLDACFQTLGAFYRDREDHRLYLPVSIDRIAVVPFSETSAQANVRNLSQANEDMLCFDFSLQSEAGDAIAQIEGMRFVEASVDRFKPSSESQSIPLHYQVQWRMQQETPAQKSLSGRWLLVSPLCDLADALSESIVSSGGECFTSMPDDPHWNEQIETAGHIVFLAPSGEEHSLDSHEVMHDVERYTANGLQTLTALSQRQDRKFSCWIVTQNAQPVLPSDRLDGISQSPLWGIGKCLMQEWPDIATHLIDLENNDPNQSAQPLLNEFLNHSKETQIAYRNGQRYTARLIESLDITPSARVPKFHADATYIVSGGTGGLGLCIAEWMAGLGAGNIVLLSRSGTIDESHRDRLESLQSKCQRVQIESCDVANQPQIDALFQRFAEEDTVVRGIIHCAGVLDDAPIQNQTAGRFHNVFLPKIAGAIHLYRAAKEYPLDAFVMFSSLSSIWGAVGQSNYVAANAFLDAFAWALRAKGVPAFSINWGPWDEVGMAAQKGLVPSLQEQGIVAVPPHQACEAFGRLLETGLTQCAVAHIDWPRLLQRFAGNIPPFLDEVVHKSVSPASKVQTTAHRTAPDIQLENVEVEERTEVLERFLADAIGGVLRIAPASFDKTAALNRLGVDSLMAVELRNKIRNRLDVDAPIAMFLDGSNTTVLAERVMNLWEDRQSDNERDEPKPISLSNIDELSAQDAERLLQNLDDLSDEEVEMLLGKVKNGLDEKQPL